MIDKPLYNLFIKYKAEPVKRHISINAVCLRCDGEVEDTLHALQDCTVVNRILRELLPSRIIVTSFLFLCMNRSFKI